MYYLVISFLHDTETLVIPTVEKGTEILEMLRTKYSRLVIQANLHVEGRDNIYVKLQNEQQGTLDHIEFSSIFGSSDFEGLKRIISSQL